MSRTATADTSARFWVDKARARVPIHRREPTPSVFAYPSGAADDEDPDFEVSCTGCIYRGPTMPRRPGQVPHSTLWNESLWVMSQPMITAIQRARPEGEARQISNTELAESYRKARESDYVMSLTMVVEEDKAAPRSIWVVIGWCVFGAIVIGYHALWALNYFGYFGMVKL